MPVDVLGAAHCSGHAHFPDHAPDLYPAPSWLQLALAQCLAALLAGVSCRCCASARCARLRRGEGEGEREYYLQSVRIALALTSCCLALAVYGSLYGLGEAFSLRRRMLQRCKSRAKIGNELTLSTSQISHVISRKESAAKRKISRQGVVRGWWEVTEGVGG